MNQETSINQRDFNFLIKFIFSNKKGKESVWYILRQEDTRGEKYIYIFMTLHSLVGYEITFYITHA